MATPSEDREQKIVIVGGGPAGVAIVRELEEKMHLATQHKVILITARPFYLHYPAAMRMTTTAEGDLEHKALIPFDDNLFLARAKVDRVIAVEPNENGIGGGVFLETGQRIPYDILVLAPGSLWMGPLNFPDGEESAMAHIEMWRARFQRAKSVAVVGGGSTGVEFAGEIKQFFPQTKTTIIHEDRQLLNAIYPDKLRTKLERNIRGSNVEIVFNDTVERFDSDNGSVVTSAGKRVDADIVIMATGSIPATDFLKSIGPGVLTNTGHIRVRPTLQLPSFPTIFAAGDATEWPEPKQLTPCMNHTEVIVANILSLLVGKPATEEYEGSSRNIVISNGKSRGVAYFDSLGGVVMGNLVATTAKSRGLMVDKARQHVLRPFYKWRF
ncbi:FAD/NAD-P-binding domain-containing protein [Amylostereum chailletii]|nr:FAD/NAD-P-binding domain-containing protein [Amylostereum chailletii]